MLLSVTAIVSRNDIANAILKLQESEKRAKQERALAGAQKEETRFKPESPSSSRTVN